MRRFQPVLLLFVLLLILSACGGDSEESIEVEVTRVVTETVEVEGEIVEEEAAEEAMADEFEPLDDVSAIGTEEDSGDGPATPVPGPKVEQTRTVAEPAAAGPPPLVRSVVNTATTAVSNETEALLQAGAIDDSLHLDAYLAYLESFDPQTAVLPIDVTDRQHFTVIDSNQNPVLNAPITLLANGAVVTELRTQSDGTAVLHPHAYGAASSAYTAQIALNGTLMELEITAPFEQQFWVINLPTPADRRVNQLDILFLLDTTGSMGDEIEQLKSSIESIATQINQLPAQPDTRFGMVTYRDRNEAYLVNLTDFTDDLPLFSQALTAVYASGGGDYPEDLHSGLDQAINEANWRSDETVRLIFLISDAPPHLDYGQSYDYVASMKTAVSRGIKIIPIASSGLDAQGEYIFRQLALFTNGRFLFLTSAIDSTSENGRSTENQSSPSYTITNLEALIVMIVEEAFAFR